LLSTERRYRKSPWQIALASGLGLTLAYDAPGHSDLNQGCADSGIAVSLVENSVKFVLPGWISAGLRLRPTTALFAI
jgi:hypothetical protein